MCGGSATSKWLPRHLGNLVIFELINGSCDDIIGASLAERTTNKYDRTLTVFLNTHTLKILVIHTHYASLIKKNRIVVRAIFVDVYVFSRTLLRQQGRTKDGED